jgi:hypothetical protein
MKRSGILLLFIALSYNGEVKAQTNQGPILVKSLSKDVITSLNVETIGGDVTVTGVPEKEGRIEVYAKTNSETVDKDQIIAALNNQYNLVINTENKKLVVSLTKRGTEEARPLSTLKVSFKIYVPASITSDIQDTGGNISILNLAGSQSLVSSGGDLRTENVTGSISGTTSGGNISIVSCARQMKFTTSGGSIVATRCDGNIDLSTSGGSVTFSKLKGTINVSTSHGNIMGNDVEGDLTAITSGGSINLSKLSCSVLAGTSGGNISAEVTEVKNNLKFVVGGGNIDLELPKGLKATVDITAKKVLASNLDNFTGSKTAGAVKGAINNGTVKIFAQAIDGNVDFKLL